MRQFKMEVVNQRFQKQVFSFQLIIILYFLYIIVNNKFLLLLIICETIGKSFLLEQAHIIFKQVLPQIQSTMFKDQNIAQSCQEPLENDSELISVDIIDFFIRGKKYNNVQARLYQNHVILKFKIEQQIFYKRIEFHFDILFHISSYKKLDKNVSEMNSCSIKFQKKQNYLELRNIHNFDQWKDHLSKKLNQRGFHEQFKPIKELGQGSFAVVYMALNIENGKKYAIKAFNKESVYSEQHGKESLIKEITIMRSLNNKNILKIHGVFQSINSTYVCVELLEGGQLSDIIKQKRVLKPREIRTIMKDILEGLEYLHRHNIMHRDLKPQNILFRKEEGQDELNCVIGDFGLAQQTNAKKWLFNKCGTSGYVAPEILNQRHFHYQRYDTACDMFSLGVIFHQLILHKLPFNGKDLSEIIQQNKCCKIMFQNQEYKRLPSAWLSLLKALLQKDPKKRITASQALYHQFFKKDPQNQNFNINKEQTSSSCSNYLMLNKIDQNQNFKPLVVRRNKNQIKSWLIKSNSNSNVPMKSNSESESIQNCLPEICLPSRIKHRASRFKQMVGGIS